MTTEKKAPRVWLGVKKIVHEWSDAGSGTTEFRPDDLRSVIEHSAYQALVDKLNHNRCNAGHETLPLKLWTCPACYDALSKELERVKAERDVLKVSIDLKHKLLVQTENEVDSTEATVSTYREESKANCERWQNELSANQTLREQLRLAVECLEFYAADTVIGFKKHTAEMFEYGSDSKPTMFGDRARQTLAAIKAAKGGAE